MATLLPHVALLRGINVGGKHKLPMTDLRELFEAQGLSRVQTYIQSGNVTFLASARQAKVAVGRLEDTIQAQFGFAVPLVTMAVDEYAALLGATPYGGEDQTKVFFGFLKDAPKPSLVKSMDPDRSPPDQFYVAGRCVHLHAPNGAARTKITSAWLDGSLGTVTTLRNWRTAHVLLDRLGSLSAS